MQMKKKTKVTTGGLSTNHNESQARDKAPGLKIKTGVKAGAINHNETQMIDAVPSLKVKTDVKAGAGVTGGWIGSVEG
jgi:hypothetical protein